MGYARQPQPSVEFKDAGNDDPVPKDVVVKTDDVKKNENENKNEDDLKKDDNMPDGMPETTTLPSELKPSFCKPSHSAIESGSDIINNILGPDVFDHLNVYDNKRQSFEKKIVHTMKLTAEEETIATLIFED